MRYGVYLKRNITVTTGYHPAELVAYNQYQPDRPRERMKWERNVKIPKLHMITDLGSDQIGKF